MIRTLDPVRAHVEMPVIGNRIKGKQESFVGVVSFPLCLLLSELLLWRQFSNVQNVMSQPQKNGNREN